LKIALTQVIFLPGATTGRQQGANRGNTPPAEPGRGSAIPPGTEQADPACRPGKSRELRPSTRVPRHERLVGLNVGGRPTGDDHEAPIGRKGQPAWPGSGTGVRHRPGRQRARGRPRPLRRDWRATSSPTAERPGIPLTVVAMLHPPKLRPGRRNPCVAEQAQQAIRATPRTEVGQRCCRGALRSLSRSADGLHRRLAVDFLDRAATVLASLKQALIGPVVHRVCGRRFPRSRSTAGGGPKCSSLPWWRPGQAIYAGRLRPGCDPQGGPARGQAVALAAGRTATHRQPPPQRLVGGCIPTPVKG